MANTITIGKAGHIAGGDALQRLNDFTSTMKGDDRLRGHKDADGNITLYVRTKAASRWTKISPKAIYHRHLAQQAIGRVLKNAERATDKPDLTTARNANAGGPRSGLDRLFKSGEVTGQSARFVVGGASAVRYGDEIREADANLAHAVAEKPHSEVVPVPSDWGPLGGAVIDDLRRNLGGEYSDELVAAAFGETLAETHGRGQRDPHDLVVSDGRAFKEDLKASLRERLGAEHDLVKDGTRLDRFVTTAFNSAAISLSDGYTAEDGKSLVLDGREYTRTKVLGAGGDGSVDLYEAENGDTVAVKFPHAKKGEEAFHGLGREIALHRKAGAADHPHVLGFKGAIRTPDGRLGIAMEAAGAGDGRKAHLAITDALKAGNISAPAATALRLTILRDMVEGMGHLSDVAGLVHLDFKDDNVLITETGYVKVSDFGRSQKIADFDLFSGRVTEAMQFVPREIKATAQVLENFDANYKNLEQRVAEVKASIKEAIPGIGDDDIAVLASAIASNERAEARAKLAAEGAAQDPTKWDAWAVASTAFRMLYERDIVDSRWVMHIEDGMEAFRADVNAVAIADQPDQGKKIGTSFGGRLGIAGSGEFLNDLLNRDPEQRKNISQMRDHRIFGDPDIGSPETRMLLVELMKKQPDANQVRALDRQLQHLSPDMIEDLRYADNFLSSFWVSQDELADLDYSTAFLSHFRL